ncbi:alpha/beta hydrolase [Flavobacterium sp. JP2137]|uniref:alpha/beta hydrolase n=1 Tax=Flavobacterium sp. JP2137 TaxID=3414510 RepID=UPI003D2FCA94
MFSLKKNPFITLLIIILSLTPVTAQEIIGIGETRILRSRILEEDRQIQVYLPPSYRNSNLEKTTYPVLYLLDSESHFHYLSGYVEKLSQGPYAAIPELIVVGIVNTHRSRDLTPSVTLDRATQKPDSLNSGGNDRFFSFIKEELFAWVEREYRTDDYKILIGHSYGGITALNALLNHTKMFQAYVVHDPSIWYDQELLLQRFEQASHADLLHSKLFLTQAGDTFKSGKLEVHFNAIKKFRALLELGTLKNLTWNYQQYAQEDHGSIPLIGNLDGLRYIFKGHQIDIKSVADQPELIAATYAKLSEELHFPFHPTEVYVDRVAHYLLRSNHFEQAFRYFMENAERHPRSANAQYSLYQYHLKIDGKTDAAIHLKKAEKLGYTLTQTPQP